MSTRVVKSIEDFVRHRMDLEVECRCGHKAVLRAREVLATFAAKKRWSTSLTGAAWLPSAHARFRCTRCGRRGADRLGPHYR